VIVNSSEQLIIELPFIALFGPIQPFNDPFQLAFTKVKRLTFLPTIKLVVIFIKRLIFLTSFMIVVIVMLITSRLD
jgi:hypothetical protein